eukprot:2162037-Prymnesium_polylepis.1
MTERNVSIRLSHARGNQGQRAGREQPHPPGLGGQREHTRGNRWKRKPCAQRWLVLTPTALHWCESPQARPLGTLAIARHSEVELDGLAGCLRVTTGSTTLTLMRTTDQPEGELQKWRGDIVEQIRRVQRSRTSSRRTGSSAARRSLNAKASGGYGGFHPESGRHAAHHPAHPHT